jgi:hypothetical protein
MRAAKKVLRRLQYAETLVLEGDESWSGVRLLLVIGLLLGLAVLARCLDPYSPNEMLLRFLPPALTQIPLFPPYTLADGAQWGLSLLGPRYWLGPAMALAWGLVLGALYLKDAFRFEHFSEAWSYLTGSLFGSGSTLTVQDGQTVNPPDKPSTLQTVGGPGYLEVRPGSAVLLERGAGPTNIYGAGRYFLRRFETLRQIVDLREIYRQREEVRATTKDGIPIILRNVEATFRLDTGRQPKRTEIQPYPFSVKAVRAATYRRAVDKEGQAKDWGDSIMGMISGRIAAWISRQRLDRLTAPLDDDPRAALRVEFEGAEARGQLARLGAELVRVNIGHLDTPDGVDSQRLNNWQSFWQSHDRVTSAQGEALKLAYEELGRAEGQADMLKTITKALETAEPAGPPGEAETNRLVILRVSQLLETMTPWEKLPEPKAPPAPRPAGE